MRMLKKYYEEVCMKKQAALRELYAENYTTSYRWQDIVAAAKQSK